MFNLPPENLKTKENMFDIETVMNEFRSSMKQLNDDDTWKNKNIELALSNIESGMDKIYKIVGKIFDADQCD